MEPKKDITNLEQLFRTDLHNYLLSIDKVDERLPEAPDIEELWQKIGESYLPDGMRDSRHSRELSHCSVRESSASLWASASTAA